MIGQVIWMDFLNNFVVKTIDNVYQGKTSNKISFSLDDFVEFDLVNEQVVVSRLVYFVPDMSSILKNVIQTNDFSIYENEFHHLEYQGIRRYHSFGNFLTKLTRDLNSKDISRRITELVGANFCILEKAPLTRDIKIDNKIVLICNHSFEIGLIYRLKIVYDKKEADLIDGSFEKYLDSIELNFRKLRLQHVFDYYKQFDIYLGNKIKQKYYKWKHNLNKNKHLEI